MEQAVEDRGGEDLVAEDGAPVRDDLVRGDEQAAPFVAARDELEKEMGAPTFKGQSTRAPDRVSRHAAPAHRTKGPKGGAHTRSVCSALHRRLRASKSPEAEWCCGERVASAVA